MSLSSYAFLDHLQTDKVTSDSPYNNEKSIGKKNMTNHIISTIQIQLYYTHDDDDFINLFFFALSFHLIRHSKNFDDEPNASTKSNIR